MPEKPWILSQLWHWNPYLENEPKEIIAPFVNQICIDVRFFHFYNLVSEYIGNIEIWRKTSIFLRPYCTMTVHWLSIAWFSGWKFWSSQSPLAYSLFSQEYNEFYSKRDKIEFYDLAWFISPNRRPGSLGLFSISNLWLHMIHL